MMCFRDMTFCPQKDCAKFNKCERALTDEVKRQAVIWWGSDSDAPIAQFIDKPDCFEEGE